jgi:hypothetical protein
MSRACPRSGPHIDFPRGDARHVPGFAMPLAEFTAHCPEVATTRSTAAYALEPPVCPTDHSVSCAAKAYVPKPRGMAVAATNVQSAGANCNCHDAATLGEVPSRFSGGTKPGRDSFTL